MSGPRKLPDGHGSGMCAVSYVLDGSNARILSCGPDGKVIAREADSPDDTHATTSGATTAALTCLASHPHGTSVVVGDDAHFVKVAPPPSCYVLRGFGLFLCKIVSSATAKLTQTSVTSCTLDAWHHRSTSCQAWTLTRWPPASRCRCAASPSARAGPASPPRATTTASSSSIWQTARCPHAQRLWSAMQHELCAWPAACKPPTSTTLGAQ